MSVYYDYLTLVEKLKIQQNIDTIKFAKDYINEIYGIIDDIVENRSLVSSIGLAYDKLRRLRDYLNENYWKALKSIVQY